ncbi:hypothetical protein [Streptomyces sp. R41]|uniref:Uncharacterized protein n=1 Tax=Streptomyces sp. R41 TaxID=3238632 RepID=A0AB39RVP7_9ACTN
MSPQQVGAIRRADGQIQITVGGWPVYRHAGDTRPGDLNGEGRRNMVLLSGPPARKPHADAVGTTQARFRPGSSRPSFLVQPRTHVARQPDVPLLFV